MAERETSPKHFVYQTRHSSAPKGQSELSKSIELIDSTINKKKREHLLNNLSNFTKPKKSLFDSKIFGKSNLLGRRLTTQESSNSKTSTISNFNKPLLSRGSSGSKNSSIKQPSERTNSSKEMSSQTGKKSAQAFVPYQPPKKAETTAKYELPNSFVYMPKTFKPAKAKASEILPEKKHNILEISESQDQSTEDMKYRFTKFTVPNDNYPPPNSSSTSRTSSYNIESPKPFIQVLKPEDDVLKAKPENDGQLSSESSVETQQGLKIFQKQIPKTIQFKEKPSTVHSIMTQNLKAPIKTQQAGLVYPQKIVPPKQPEVNFNLALHNHEISPRKDESESVRIINHEIERMIHGLKVKHRKTPL